MQVTEGFAGNSLFERAFYVLHWDGGFGLSEFETLSFALQTAMAEFGQQMGEPHQSSRIVIDGFFECGEVELSKQFGDTQSGDRI